MSTALKCTTCHLVFDTLDTMRTHFASGYHTNNVRLRVDGQKPLTQSEYRHSVAADPTGIDADADGDAVDDTPAFSCTLCKKTFRSIQTLQSHVKSTAHLMRKEQRIIARDSEAASMLTSTSLGSAAMGLHRRHKTHNRARNQRIVDPTAAAAAAGAPAVVVPAADREEDASELRCMLCGLASESAEATETHLMNAHNFTIPLRERCANLVGLLQYLARKVNGLMCLTCGESTRKFDSLEALRAHMRAADHERVILSAEYAEFYTGPIDDDTAAGGAAPDGADEQRGELVLVGGTRRTVFCRDRQTTGLVQRHRETEQRTEQRRLLQAQDKAANAVVRRERLEAERPMTAQLVRDVQRQGFRYHQQQLRVGLRTNKLHPKGYDGEGEVN